jgi:maleylacetate reductase
MVKIKNFTHKLPNQKVIFGVGALSRIGDELDHLGFRSPFIICSAGRGNISEIIMKIMDAYFNCHYEYARSYIYESDFDRSKLALIKAKSDCLIAAGGGSIIGLGKALAATLQLPLVAIIMTYSGSEMRNNWTVGRGSSLRSGRDDRALPLVVIYDPLLTRDLPVGFSVASGVNAMSHAVESLYGEITNSNVQDKSEEAIRILSSFLPKLLSEPKNLVVRTEILYGAWLAATFRGGVGISHLIARIIGGEFSLTHAEIHAVVLPYAIWFNKDFSEDAMVIIERAMGTEDAAGGVYDLNNKLGLRTNLQQFGIKERDLDTISKIILSKSFYNPREGNADEILKLLYTIFEGTRPI